MNDRLNTTFGWILASAGIALGGSIVAGMYFHGDDPELAEGQDPGYAIEVPEDGAVAEEGPSIAVRLANGSAEAGAAAFARCQSCHAVTAGTPSGLGPNIHGIVGQPIGSGASDFSYSSALSNHGGSWTYEALDQWLASPAAFIPGNQMAFPGLSDAQARADLILYLRENGGGPALPVPEEEPAEGEGATDAADQNQPREETGAQSADDPVAAANAATANE